MAEAESKPSGRLWTRVQVSQLQRSPPFTQEDEPGGPARDFAVIMPVVFEEYEQVPPKTCTENALRHCRMTWRICMAVSAHQL